MSAQNVRGQKSIVINFVKFSQVLAWLLTGEQMVALSDGLFARIKVHGGRPGKNVLVSHSEPHQEGFKPKSPCKSQPWCAWGSCVHGAAEESPRLHGRVVWRKGEQGVKQETFPVTDRSIYRKCIP